MAQGGGLGPVRMPCSDKAGGRTMVRTNRAAAAAIRGHAQAVRCLRAVLLPERSQVKPAVHKSMVGNKGKDTKPELLVRQRLRQEGICGYRLQWKAPGRPDIAFPSKKVAIFVNGCFWHRCPICKPPAPKTRLEYWVPKFQRNVERDAANQAALEAAGWRVFVIWECELKKDVREQTFAFLLPALREALAGSRRA